jgi:hypothetical protein
MDRSIARQNVTPIEYNIDVAMNWGDMHPDMLSQRFEETNSGPDEGLVDNYIRTQLVDWRPDAATFEHERPRGAVNARSGRIQAQYYGHRGCNEVDNPEAFLGFGGLGDADPRGINVDPDIRQLRKQEESRMRFIRFSPDSDQSITGGGRSEGQLMHDKQTAFRITRDRLKVFDRQIDGRRTGLRRVYGHKSNVDKQVYVQSYGDFIRDYALTPQRRANIICKQMLRDSRAYREGTADQDFHIANYTRLCKSGATVNKYRRVLGAQESDDTIWSQADDSIQYKTLGILLGNLVSRKREVVKSVIAGDIDAAESNVVAARKTAPMIKDLNIILQSTIVDETQFAASDTTVAGKTAMPQQQQHLARITIQQHSVPTYHNIALIYKAVKPGADMRKIRDQVITDANAPELRDTNTPAMKSSMTRTTVSGAKLPTVADGARTAETTKVFNYKSLSGSVKLGGPREVVTVTSESDQTPNRSTNHSQYRAASVDDTEQMAEFNDNAVKERLGGKLGPKYMNRYVDRDGSAADITALS